jgi:hypothetical protein
METKLTLIMKDGLVSISSQSALTSSQYSDLHAVVSETILAADLIKKISGLSTAWGIPVAVEQVTKPKP